MNDIDDRIRSLGQKSDFKSLQEYISKLDTDTLLELIDNRINGPTFTYTWNYLLKGFDDTLESQRKRYRVVKKSLEVIETCSGRTKQIETMLRRLCMELGKFASRHIIDLCDFCIESIQNIKSSAHSWKELFPELIKGLIELDKVEFNNEVISGRECRDQLMINLLSLQWPVNIVTSLTAMFIDIVSSKEEFERILSKLGHCIEKMTVQELPAFTYQLLKLCKHSDGLFIFLRLQLYFGARVYDGPSYISSVEPSSIQFDCIESASKIEAFNAESTVLYHIHTAAMMGYECIRNYIVCVRSKLLRSPEFILHPFQLTVLLIISTVPHYEHKILDEILRTALSRSYQEQRKRNDSAWFRDIITNELNVEDIVSHVIHLSIEERELVLQGFVSLAFVLLSVPVATGNNYLPEKLWQLGTIILLKIVKRKRHTAPLILGRLSNHILTSPNVSAVRPFLECLYLISKDATLMMLENKASMIELLDNAVQMSTSSASMLLNVIVPLVKISPTVRDHLTILLRKSLFSRDGKNEHRHMAVMGYLRLLSTLKIKDLNSLSQLTESCSSFDSGHSIYTQISISHHTQSSATSCFTNEALCLEVLGTLRRCFMEQAQTKSQLYDGLYDVICNNADLTVPILNMLWNYGSKFYERDENIMPPVTFKTAIVIKDMDTILQEPISKYINTLATIIRKVDIENMNYSCDNNALNKRVEIINMLESLCVRMQNCELAHFELDDGVDLLDVLPESKQKCLILLEVVSILEVLIAYAFSRNTINVQEVIRLLSAHQRFAVFAKTLHKPKKYSDKNKTVSSQSINKKSNIGNKESIKLMSRCGDAEIWSFETSIQILQLLYNKESSSNVSDWTTLQSKHELHHMAMQCAFTHVQSAVKFSFKQTSSTTDNFSCIPLHLNHNKELFKNLCYLGLILYKNVIVQLRQYIEFDKNIALIAIECFYLVFQLISESFTPNFYKFLYHILEKDLANDDSSISPNKEFEDNVIDQHTHQCNVLLEVLKQFEQLITMNLDELVGKDTTESKKMSLIIVQTFASICLTISINNNGSAAFALEVARRVADFPESSMCHKAATSSFMMLSLDLHIRFKIGLTFLEAISVRLGELTGVISDQLDQTHSADLQILTESSTPLVFQVVCNTLKVLLENIDWIIDRLRSDYYAITINTGSLSENQKRQQHLKTNERAVCRQLCLLVVIMTNLSNCTILPGAMSESVLKGITFLYSSLTNLTKYFTLRSSKANPIFQDAKFEHLIKLCGKQLAPAVYRLLTYLDESQRANIPETKNSQSQTQMKKRKTPANTDGSTLKIRILKETRLFPKVVYEMEQFSLTINQLSKKCNIDVAKNIGQGTARDFRIVHLREVLKEQNAETTLSETVESSETSIVIDESVIFTPSDTLNNSQSEPPSKRPKTD